VGHIFVCLLGLVTTTEERIWPAITSFRAINFIPSVPPSLRSGSTPGMKLIQNRQPSKATTNLQKDCYTTKWVNSGALKFLGFYGVGLHGSNAVGRWV
jgi:hypothetical protein